MRKKWMKHGEHYLHEMPSGEWEQLNNKLEHICTHSASTVLGVLQNGFAVFCDEPKPPKKEPVAYIANKMMWIYADKNKKESGTVFSALYPNGSDCGSGYSLKNDSYTTEIDAQALYNHLKTIVEKP